jgi:aspartyl-tRNA(Asn)/glutamyl-tRNA(Gln) amidotransferase subunit A
MAGADDKDSTSLTMPKEDFTRDLNAPLTGLRIGLPKQYFTEQLNPAIADAIRTAVGEMEKLGAVVKEIELPNSELALSAYYVIAPAEASTNLSRFDGVRYGYRCENPKDLEDLYKRSRSEGFGEEVKRRIMIGTYALSAGYYDAYYRKAQKIRRLVKEDFAQAFADVDVIIGPTTPSPAFGLDSIKDSVTMYLEDIYTIALNLAGLPGISVPAGFVDGLPVGMQIIATDFAEAKLLNVAHQYQQVSDWHSRKPTQSKEA